MILARALAAAMLLAVPCLAATPQQVLVVVNDSSAISQAIGAYYVSLRSIPAVNVCHLPAGTPTTETITRAQYNAQFRDVIASYLTVAQPQLQTQCRYIVLTKDVPIRVAGTNNASVDSELTLLLTGLLPDNGLLNWTNNPYFNKAQSFSSFTGGFPRFLVCRLDGYEDNVDAGTGVPGDIKGLIDRAQSPATSGTFLLDKDPSKTGGYQVGNDWIDTANSLLTQLGQSPILDATSQFQKNVNGLIGYASWGSNDSFTAGPPYYGEVPAGSGDHYPGTFLSGAIVTDYVSTNGRTFLKSGQTYGQSLIADLIHLGASGCAGYVDEPFLQACARPSILFPRYLNGHCAADAYYMAIPYLSWQNVVVVDPLMQSGIVAYFPPTISAVYPDRGPQSGGNALLVSGLNLGAPGDAVAATIGGQSVPASFASPNVVGFNAPPHGPGPVDVSITVAGGTATRVNGYLYLPALTLTGSSSIGQTANLDVDGEFGQSYVLFLGSGTANLNAPPYGVLLLDPAALFVPLLTSNFGTFQNGQTVPLPIPSDNALIGLTARFQAIVGNLVPLDPENRFTNRIDLTIAP